MSVTLNIDTREFEAELRKRVERSKNHDLPWIVNRVAMGLANQAWAATPRADRKSIEATLGARIRIFIGKRGKQLKKTRREFAAPTNRALFAQHLRKNLKINPRSLSPGQFDEMMPKHFSHRLSGVGYLRAGWAPVIRKLANIVKKPVPPGLKQFGKAKGSVKPARQGFSPVAEIINSILSHLYSKDPASHERAKRHSIQALRDGIARETAEMKMFAQKLAGKFCAQSPSEASRPLH